MTNLTRPRLTPDQIGDTGELLAALALSRPVMGRYKRPLFKPTHLGGKYPAADFLVDTLSAAGESTGFFFVQVKSTTRVGHRRSHQLRRLHLTMEPAKLARLARLPAPTYVVGVDTVAERACLVAAFGRQAPRRGSITTDYPLASEAVRIGLYGEVLAHWCRAGRRPTRTRFANG